MVASVTKLLLTITELTEAGQSKLKPILTTMVHVSKGARLIPSQELVVNVEVPGGGRDISVVSELTVVFPVFVMVMVASGGSVKQLTEAIQTL